MKLRGLVEVVKTGARHARQELERQRAAERLEIERTERAHNFVVVLAELQAWLCGLQHLRSVPLVQRREASVHARALELLGFERPKCSAPPEDAAPPPPPEVPPPAPAPTLAVLPGGQLGQPPPLDPPRRELPAPQPELRTAAKAAPRRPRRKSSPAQEELPLAPPDPHITELVNQMRAALAAPGADDEPPGAK